MYIIIHILQQVNYYPVINHTAEQSTAFLSIITLFMKI